MGLTQDITTDLQSFVLMCWFGSGVIDGLAWLWCRFCHAVHVQLGVGMLQAKALAGVAAGGMTAASLTPLSPLGALF